MKKFALPLAFMSLLSLAAASTPGNNLVVLNDGAKLCYDGYAVVDGKESKTLNKSAETRMSAMLSGLGIKASEFAAADRCDRVVSLAYEMDNKGAPGIVVARLELLSNLTLDNDQDVALPTLWEGRTWRAQKGIYSTQEAQKVFDTVLSDLFKLFKDDYAQRNPNK